VLSYTTLMLCTKPTPNRYNLRYRSEDETEFIRAAAPGGTAPGTKSEVICMEEPARTPAPTDCGTRGGWYYERALRPAGTARHSSSATPSNFTRAVCPMRMSCMPVAAPVEMT